MKTTIKYNWLKIWGLACILLTSVSCDDFLTIENPEDKTIIEGYYNSAQRIEQAVIGMYVDFRRALLDNNAWLMYGEARAGDLIVNTDYNKHVASQELNTKTIELNQLKDWGYFYDVINDANEVLDIVANVEEGVITEYETNLFKGEALALKSYAYFYLVRIWGSVLSAEDVDFGKPLDATAMTQKAIGFAEEAYELLPWILLNSDGIESASLTQTRMSKTAVSMMLTQEYLWINESQKAYNALAKIDLTSNEVTPSEFGFSLGADARTEITEEPLSNDVVSIDTIRMQQIYPEGDSRRELFYVTSDSKTASLIGDVNSVSNLLNDELFGLLQVETNWRVGNTDKAISLLVNITSLEIDDVIVSLVIEDYSTLKEDEIEAAILKERQRMLIGCGYRFFDLIRFNKVPDNTILSAQDVANGAAFWPLSEQSLMDNSLTQNSYWSDK